MLARDDAGAERIFQNNGLPLLLNLIETGKPEMILAAIRTLSGMCTGHKARVREIRVQNTELLRSLLPHWSTYAGLSFAPQKQAMAILHMVGVDKMCSIMAIDNEEIALATCNLFQCINDSLTGGDKREYGKEEALVLGETEKYILLFLPFSFPLEKKKMQRSSFWYSCVPPRVKLPGPRSNGP